LTEIQNLAFANQWGFSPNTVEEIRYRARMSFCRPEGILLLMNEEEPVGFNWTRIEEGPRHVIGFISMMGSHPDYRGLGLGVAVMRAGVNYLREAEVDRVQLTVDSQNRSAYKIYNAAGFERSAVTLWYERRL
ncbi:MAG: GNAT family N-acetyltransferase, partial [Dehalococcoidia bacterium]